MFHPSARAHAFFYGLFRQGDKSEAMQLQASVRRLAEYRDVLTEAGREELIVAIAQQVTEELELDQQLANTALRFTAGLFHFEKLFVFPDIDWDQKRSVAEYWKIKDELRHQLKWLKRYDEVCELLLADVHRAMQLMQQHLPKLPPASASVSGITVPTRIIDMVTDLGPTIEQVAGTVFGEEENELDLFRRHRERLEANLILASGGNPADPESFRRAPKTASKSDIKSRIELVSTYLGGTPMVDLFAGTTPFTIPEAARFEHHHIVAGSGHGKTQTLQYLIANDLEAVKRGQRSVVVIDSQGDLIRNIAELQLFAPGQPLHDRLCLIDPADIEYPVSLNLFDVGQNRLANYEPLEQERLTNSILELYDFVLGSLLSAGMTQKQEVIFRYVTRLMLHIPDATIHTLRDLMEPNAEVKFAEHIAKLKGSAAHFFDTEFVSREFKNTKEQVLRRLWGILENQTFERMFSHPRSKLDLFSEMNAGKVILINTAKDLLKASGTEIFGRFFIALIAQAAQERAVLPANRRMPTIVYIDEAADYFDRNIETILAQARKYNVGIVLAHQYLGQLEPKLQEAFSANTAIKFAGGVSAKDARSLGQMMGCEPGFIEQQPKFSFAASVRGRTADAVPLQFPAGHLEQLPKMNPSDREALRAAMRDRYAVHYSKVFEDTTETARSGKADEDVPNDSGDGEAGSGPDITPTPQW